MLPVSQVVSRIVGNTSGLSQVASPGPGPSSSATCRPSSSGGAATTNDELHSSFPGLYGPRGVRHQPYSRPRPKPRYNYTPRPPKNFLKQVVLVDVGTTGVPRGQAWQDLHDQGCIADVLEINGAWTEQEVFQALEGAFSKVLDQSHPPPRYLIECENCKQRFITVNNSLNRSSYTCILYCMTQV